MKAKIKNNQFLFITFFVIRAYSLYFLNQITNYQLERIKFFKALEYQPNLQNPQSFNEKIFWKKIYDRNPLLPVTADKYEVRSYIKEVLGEEKAKELLVPLLYVTDKPETIPFDRLPSSFIIKPNHASGRYIIVENGHYNQREIIMTCRRWLRTSYGLEKMEWAYQPIKRKIVIEELLIDEGGIVPIDFKFHMFHGKCKSISVFFNRMTNRSKSTFDEHWNFLPVKNPSRPQGPKIDKPENYEIMLELAEILAKPFDYVRVDLYNIKGKIYISELTHYPKSGLLKYEPVTYDFELGRYWSIESEYWKKE